jgi:hypothetical protein
MSNFKSTKTERSGSLFGEVIFNYTRARANRRSRACRRDPNRLGSWIPLPCGRESRPHGGSGDYPAAILARYRRPVVGSYAELGIRDLLWMAFLTARRAKPGFLTDRL